MESQELLNFRARLDERRMYTDEGAQYWLARDLETLLGYDTWQKFERAIKRAMRACESVGANVADHFSEAANVITAGKGAQIQRADYFLSRYACYLIAMTGDTRKPEIGFAQTYFAVQTRKQERFDDLTEAEKRIELRERVRDNNKHLNEAAQQCGVIDYQSFHAAGYRGLYGGLNMGQVKQRKNIPAADSILDRAGRAELAAHDFRITQTEEQLQGLRGEAKALTVHHTVGTEVRDAITRIRGTMPEDLPAEPHIKHLLKEHKARKKRLLKEGS